MKNRAFSTIESFKKHDEREESSIGGGSDGDRSSVINEPLKIGKKVSGYFKELVYNVAKVKIYYIKL